MRAGGAGGGRGGIRPARAVTNGNLAGGEIDDRCRDEKRRDAVRALFEQDAMFALDHLESANAAADVHADAVAPFALDGKPGIGHGELGSSHRELYEARGLADLLLLHVPLGVEVLDLAGEARGKAGRVEQLDVGNAAASLADGAPGFFRANANGAEQTDAGNDNSARQNVYPPRLLFGGLVLDIVDRVFHRRDLFRVFVGNVYIEGFFEGHDQLDDVERVGAQVIDERGGVIHLILIDPELFHDDLFHLLLNGHESSLVVASPRL